MTTQSRDDESHGGARSGQSSRGSQRGEGSARKKSTQQEPTQKKAAAKTSSRQLSPVQVARQVAEQLEELTGKAPESVTAVESTEDGWSLQYEVVESRRIPDSADMLALYEAQAGTSGDLVGYRRLRRYARGHTGDDPQGGRS